MLHWYKAPSNVETNIKLHKGVVYVAKKDDRNVIMPNTCKKTLCNKVTPGIPKLKSNE